MRLTSALRLNASNQIIVLGAFVVRKMWTCRAFNERILRMECIPILLFLQACGRAFRLKG